jgi:NarL family two-component system response regulator YdfI
MTTVTYPSITTLIVDDQEDIRLLLRLLIEAANAGLSVVGEAASGRDALLQVEKVQPTVIIFDEMMPEMSGVEAARQVRRSRPSQIMILCSAYLDNEVIARARSAGMSAWLPKEQITELPDLIRRIVSDRDNPQP